MVLPWRPTGGSTQESDVTIVGQIAVTPCFNTPSLTLSIPSCTPPSSNDEKSTPEAPVDVRGKLREKLGSVIETYKLCYIINDHTHSSVRSQVWFGTHVNQNH